MQYNLARAIRCGAKGRACVVYFVKAARKTLLAPTFPAVDFEDLRQILRDVANEGCPLAQNASYKDFIKTKNTPAKCPDVYEMRVRQWRLFGAFEESDGVFLVMRAWLKTSTNEQQNEINATARILAKVDWPADKRRFEEGEEGDEQPPENVG